MARFVQRATSAENTHQHTQEPTNLDDLDAPPPGEPAPPPDESARGAEDDPPARPKRPRAPGKRATAGAPETPETPEISVPAPPVAEQVTAGEPASWQEVPPAAEPALPPVAATPAFDP